MTRTVRGPLAAAWAAIGALHVYAALTVPVGEYNDDAIGILLARALRHGAFSLPDGLGLSATYPPPGYPFLLAPLAWLAEPHWGALRFFGLAASALLVFATWRLARKILSEEWALAAALIVSLNNVFLIYSGAVMPDILYAACSLLLLAAFTDHERNSWRLAAAAGLAALLRPHGLILIASLGLALGARRGWRRGIQFSLIALLPSGLWAARNYAVAGTSSGYLSYWTAMWAHWDFHVQLVHAARVMATYIGQGLLGLVGLPFGLLLAAAAAATALMAYGAFRTLRKNDDAGLAAAAVYAAAILLVQMAWKIEVVRYLLPVLPICWIYLLKAVADLSGRRRWPTAVFVLLAAAAAVRLDASFLRGKSQQASWRPATMSWIRENIPATARLQAGHEGSVMLLSGRQALPPFDGISREQWPAAARQYQIGYVLLDSSSENPGPGLVPVYRNEGEGALVLNLRP